MATCPPLGRPPDADSLRCECGARRRPGPDRARCPRDRRLDAAGAARRARRGGRRDDVRRQLRRRPGEGRPARPAAAPGRLGGGFVGLVRPVPLRRLDRRRRRRARGRRRPARDAGRTSGGAAGRYVRVGLGPRRPLPAGRHAARPVRSAAAGLAPRHPGRPGDHHEGRGRARVGGQPRCRRRLRQRLQARRARAGLRHGPAGRRVRLLRRPARRPGRLGRGGRAVPPRVRARAARALGRRRGPGVRGRHLGAGAQRHRGGRPAARLPHVVLAEGRRAGRRQRRARAPLAVARRHEPDGRWPRRPLRADRRRRGVRRGDPRAPAGPDGGRRARRHVVPPARALALGGDVRLLGTGEPRGGRAHGHRVARGDVVGRQRRGQVLRPARQPVPGVRGPGRRRPLRPGHRFVAARPGRRRPGRARRRGARVARDRPPPAVPARGGGRLRRRRGGAVRLGCRRCRPRSSRCGSPSWSCSTASPTRRSRRLRAGSADRGPPTAGS